MFTSLLQIKKLAPVIKEGKVYSVKVKLISTFPKLLAYFNLRTTVQRFGCHVVSSGKRDEDNKAASCARTLLHYIFISTFHNLFVASRCTDMPFYPCDDSEVRHRCGHAHVKLVYRAQIKRRKKISKTLRGLKL